MNKDAIRKMFNAKCKYIVRCTYQEIQQQIFWVRKTHTEIIHIVVERCSKYSKPKNFISGLDREFYCLKDVKEYIKFLKKFNHVVKPQVIGL